MLFSHNGAASDTPSTPRTAREKELESLLHSGVVRDHTQLRRLLVYLGSKSLDDSPEPLKEYTIGVEALNKPEDYDPRLDPTVRVEVAKLRKKLQEFYRGPGAGHDVQLLIPKGGYLPVFAAGTATRHLAVRWGARLLIAAVLAAIALAVVGWVRRAPAQPPLAPELEAFWAPHLVKDTSTILVYGTPLFTKLDGSFFRDPRVNTPEEAAASGPVGRVTEAMGPKESRPVFGFTGAGEAEALFLLTKLLSSSHAPLIAHASSRLTWDDLKGKHAILLGGRKYNPLIPDLPYKPRFEAVRRAIFELGDAGTPVRAFQTASKTPHGEITEEYALVSVYPGLSPGTRLVILDGSSSEGTLAAAEFLTRPDTLRELGARKLPLVRAGEAVRPFQVVVGAKINKGVVVSVFYVTHALLS